VAGFADAHSAAVSASSLVAAQKMTAAEAVYPVLAALTTNYRHEDRARLHRRQPRLRVLGRAGNCLLVAAAAWAGAFLVSAPR
jgi:hypothetical protein